MSQTALQYLDSIISALTPPANYFDAHRAHRGSIETRLDNWYGLSEMFETGSLRHGTGIRIYSDADYFAVMKGTRPTPDTALLRVKTALQDRYPNTTIQIRQPTVKCRFANGAEIVEIVPAFPADAGGYWMPDPRQGGWMRSNPKTHNNYVNSVNQNHSGAAKKLARLAKIWKYQRNVPISSCYLEMRAAKYVDGLSSWIAYIDLHFFFRELARVELAAMNDPTGTASRFSACSSESTKADALSKLATAVTRSETAWGYASQGEHAAAIQTYKLLFGL